MAAAAFRALGGFDDSEEPAVRMDDAGGLSPALAGSAPVKFATELLFEVERLEAGRESRNKVT